MKNKIVPDHGLALSTELNKSKLLSIPMDGVQALDYLRKNNLNLTSPQTGFHLVEFQGLPLGWVNMLGGRINNLYPSGRRILMK
jgi:NOL1/NOP2/fmu family ribosome biogenesis protein